MKQKKASKLVEKAINDLTPKQLFDLKNRIEAKEMVINSQVLFNNDQDLTIGRVVWEKWININNWANYFANRWKYETKDMKHNMAINYALRAGYIYGDSGIWNNNGTPTNIIVSHCDLNFCYFTLSPTEQERLEQLRYETKKKKQGLIKKPKNEIINYQFDSLGYGAFITLDPVLKLEEYIQKAIFNEAMTLPTRIIRDINDANTDNRTAKQFLELKSPVINRYKGGNETYEGLTLSSSTDGLLNLIEASKNWYYDILGRRTNSDFKLSHTLEQEAKNSEFNVNAIEWDRYLFFKKFIQEYAKLFKIKIKIENLNGDFGDCFNDLELELKNEVKPNNETTNSIERNK